MAIERTFSIIKPDATARNVTGAVNAMIEKAGLRIVAQKRIKMSREQAETFYAVHRARPFFGCPATPAVRYRLSPHAAQPRNPEFR